MFLCLDGDTAEVKPASDWRRTFSRIAYIIRRARQKERLGRCPPSARRHSQPQIHSHGNQSRRKLPTAQPVPMLHRGSYNRAYERGLAANLYPLWEAKNWRSYRATPARADLLCCHACVLRRHATSPCREVWRP